MRWIKTGWVVFIAVIYLALSAWYGGAGKPISAEEGERLISDYIEVHGEDDESGLLRNIRDLIPRDDGNEFYAVNLERLKSGPDAEAADRAYANIVMPELFKRASHPVFLSTRKGLMLGEYGNQVDRVAVVRYRSLRDMISMASSSAMADGGDYKFAALEHTEVFITRPMITFVQVRLILALLLILLAIAGWKALSLIENKRAKRRTE